MGISKSGRRSQNFGVVLRYNIVCGQKLVGLQVSLVMCRKLGVQHLHLKLFVVTKVTERVRILGLFSDTILFVDKSYCVCRAF